LVFKPATFIMETPDAEESALHLRRQGIRQNSREAKSDPKRTLVLADNKGGFLRKCPGTSNYICCGYQILHVGTGCPMDCSYCILQSYLTDHRLRVFTNLDALARELAHTAQRFRNRLFRLGTGEFTDSLYQEPFFPLAERLVPWIQREPNLLIEFKTKTENVESLRALADPDRVVVSFSLNSASVWRREERSAPSPARRIRAAERCLEKGFKLGFHFDPLVWRPNWRQGYGETLDVLFDRIDPGRIIWISLGCLRFMPPLKSLARIRHPRSTLFSGEFVRGLDGKMRYFRPVREEMYGWMAERIRKADPNACIYLCMESDLVWRRSLGWSPGDSEGLAAFLDRRSRMFFPSLSG